MNREFLDLYNRELQLLNEQAREFAEGYPGIAERLGGILEDRIDPMVGGLLEQLVPHFLAPTPSAMIVQVVPSFGDKSLHDGLTIPRHAYLDASFRERD